MKPKLILLPLALIALAFSGCLAPSYVKFVGGLPAVTATDITQTTTTPVYSHQESASGISTDPVTGMLTITNGKASAAIPELGVQWSLNVSGLKVQASPAQLAAAVTLNQAAVIAPLSLPPKTP